jgi:hypothetical protein
MGRKLKGKKPLPLWRRILLGLVVTAMALLAVLILISYVEERRFGAEIVKVRQAGEPVTFLDLRADFNQGGTDEDASDYYADALGGMRPEDVEDLKRVNIFYRKNISSLPASQFPSEVRDKITKNLAKVQPMLERFDKGAGLPLSGFDMGIEQGMQVCRSRLDRVESAFFLLSLRTLDLLLNGEDDAAVSSSISMLRMLRIFDFYPVMILHRAKLLLARLACEDITLLLAHGRPSEKSLAKLQQVMLEIIPSDALEKTFFAERVYQIEIARNLVPENIASQFLDDNIPNLPERLSQPVSRWTRLRLHRASVRYLRDMARLITASRLPWPEPIDALVGDASRPDEKASKLITNGTALARFTGQMLAFVRCSILAVAVERYRLSHGELPGSLNEIAPAYIDAIPLDPFMGQKLLYSPEVESYVIYSVGINRQDDGGSIITKEGEERPQDLGFRIGLPGIE